MIPLHVFNTIQTINIYLLQCTKRNEIQNICVLCTSMRQTHARTQSIGCCMGNDANKKKLYSMHACGIWRNQFILFRSVLFFSTFLRHFLLQFGRALGYVVARYVYASTDDDICTTHANITHTERGLLLLLILLDSTLFCCLLLISTISLNLSFV